MSKILISGGVGFLGSHLVERLVEDGNKVTILDDLSAGKIENISSVRKKVEFIKGGVENYKLVDKLVKGKDIVYHLATPCLVVGLEDPLKMHTVTDLGTLNICLAVKNHNSRLVSISTSEIYGRQDKFPIREDAKPNPVSIYGLTKLIGETYVSFFHKLYGVPSVIIRPFNIFGPKHREDRYACVVTDLVRRAHRGEELILQGNGMQRRDLTYISDTVNGILTLSHLKDGEIVNIGNGRDISILELAEMIYYACGMNLPKVKFTKARPNDVRCLLADTNLAKSYGFKPELTLEEGIHQYIAWYKDTHG